MTEKKKKTVFLNGAISPGFIADSITAHSKKTTIGAHDIFLGQVRADFINGKSVVAIEYSAYQEMAEQRFNEIREAAFLNHDLICMHIYHSLGVVKAGEICLFVFVSSKNRASAFSACRDVVEQIKFQVPVWGKEIFQGEEFVWKKNKPEESKTLEK